MRAIAIVNIKLYASKVMIKSLMVNKHTGSSYAMIRLTGTLIVLSRTLSSEITIPICLRRVATIITDSLLQRTHPCHHKDQTHYFYNSATTGCLRQELTGYLRG